MTIKELKEITPLVDVYELNPHAKYIAFVSETTFGMREMVKALSKELNGGTIFVVPDGSETPKMFDVSEETP